MLWLMIGISLVSAYWIGKVLSTSNEQELIQDKFDDYKVVYIEIKRQLYELQGAEDTLYFKTEESIGYGGRMVVGTAADKEGNITQVELISDTETFSYITKLRKKSYFYQFQKRPISSALEIGYDIDAVSGATISSKAIAKAARNSSNYLSEEIYHQTPEIIPYRFSVASYEWGIFTFFILSIGLTFWLKNRKYKLVTYLLSLLLLGFVWNTSFSVAFFSKLLLGEIPPFSEGLLFWLLIVFFIGGILFFKKNLYCFSICPFHAIQHFLSKISGVKWGVHPFLKKYTQRVNGFLLWLVLIIALVNNNATASSYEPFSMAFALQGNGVQWYIFPFVMIGSMFVSQFFCRFFCPIGALSTYALKARKGKLFAADRVKTCSHACHSGVKQQVQHLIVGVLYFLSLFAILYYLMSSAFAMAH